MPVAGVKRSKSPNDSTPSQPASDDGIFRDVIVVIKIDEREFADGPKNGQRGEREQESDEARSRHCFGLSDFSMAAKRIPPWSAAGF